MIAISSRYDNKNEALYGIRLALINTTIPIGWAMIAGLVVISLFRPEAFGKPIWGLIICSVLLHLIITVTPWKSLLKKETVFHFAFAMNVLIIVLLSAVNYYFHVNRVFPFMLLIIFSAIFYDRKHFIVLTAAASVGFTMSIIPLGLLDMLIVEIAGMFIFSLLSYKLASAYKYELSSNFQKSKRLAENIEQLQHVNKASLILKSQVYLDDFIQSFLEISAEITKSKHAMYISIEKQNYSCYRAKQKRILAESFSESNIYKAIVGGEEISLPVSELSCCEELDLNDGAAFMSPVIYQDHIYGAIVLVGKDANHDSRYLLNTINNHAAVGIFKRHMLQEIEEAKLVLEEKDKVKRELLKQLMTVQEDERKRIARELHDEIGQTLSSLLITLEMTYKEAADEPLKDTLEILINECEGTISEIDRIIWSLRPTILDDLGLVPALRSLARRYTDRMGLEIDFDLPDNYDLNESIQTALYRFAQESLNNIIKHSQATMASIKLFQQNGQVKMTISDNGIGFEANRSDSDAVNTMGLQGIRERLSMFGGELSIITNSNGTSLRAVIPLSTKSIEELRQRETAV